MSKNDRPLGPSGRPILHFKLCNSRKEAEEEARKAGNGEWIVNLCFALKWFQIKFYFILKGPPIHDTTHKQGQYPHYHPADRYGKKIENGTHFQYPQDTKQYF